MSKRTVLTLGLTALLVAFSMPIIGISQPTGVPQAGENGRQAQSETQLLIAINRAGLSLEQMQTIRAALQPLLDGQAQAETLQAELQDFLISWNGSAEDFDAAFEAARQPLTDLRTTMQENAQAFQDTVANTLTVAQGQILRQLVSQRGGPDRDAGPQQDGQGRGGPGAEDADGNRDGRFGQQRQGNNDGPGNDRANGPQMRRGQGGPQGRGGPGRGGPGNGFAQLQVLANVLDVKIEALS
jgi:hypothetical protein